MGNLDKAKKVLRITGLIKLVVGSTLLLYDVTVYGFIILLIGLYFFYQSYKDEGTIYNNRVIYLILSIIGIRDLVGSIILFICYNWFYSGINSANAPPKKIYSIDKDAKKIDILLKLGIFMVFISGLIFATTSWDIVPNLFKVIALVLFGVLFLALSIFTEESLKLYKSAFLYWMLSMAFFVFTVIGLLYFEIISQEVSFIANKSLAYGLVFLAATGLLFASHFKYPDKNLLNSSLFTLCISIFFIIYNYTVSYMEPIIVFAIVALIANIVNRGKSETIEKFAIALSAIIVGITIGAASTYYFDGSSVLLIIAVIVNLINISIVTHKLDDAIGNYIGLYLSYSCIFMLFYPMYKLYVNYPIGIMIIMSLFTLTININFIHDNKIIKYINSCLYFILTLILLFICYGNISSVIIALIFTIFIFIYSRVLNKEVSIKIYKYLETFTIALLISSILSMILVENAFITSLAVISVIYCIIYTIYSRINKEKNMLVLYGISSLIINSIALVGETNYSIPWVAIIIVFTSLYLFILNYNKENNYNKIVNCVIALILFLTSVYIPFISNNMYLFNDYLITMFYILFLLLIILIFRDKKITICIIIYTLVPLLNLMNNVFIDDTSIDLILTSLVGFYVMFIVLYLLIKNYTLRNIFAIIGCVFLLMEIFSLDGALACIYIGIIGLAYVLIGFVKDELYPMFIMGVIVIVVDLIKSLWDLWALIPFWLYLLVIGLSIIAFAMNREIKKQKKKS